MLTIHARTDVSGVLGALVDFEKQLPYAMATALTKTGQDVKTAEVAEIRDTVNNPTPYTQNSVFLQFATKSRLQARVWLKDGNRPEHYLLPLIEGGGRPMKRFEQRLRMLGYMRPDERAVPGTAVQLDAYGNMSRGTITKILSQLKTAVVQGDFSNASNSRRSKAKRAGVAYFASAGPGSKRPVFGKASAGQHLPRGIWERRIHGHGVSVRPVLLFVKRTNYSKRFDFFGVAEQVTEARFPVHIKDAVETTNAAWFRSAGRK